MRFDGAEQKGQGVDKEAEARVDVLQERNRKGEGDKGCTVDIFEPFGIQKRGQGGIGSRNREEWKGPGSKYNQKPKSKGLNYRTAKHN